MKNSNIHLTSNNSEKRVKFRIKYTENMMNFRRMSYPYSWELARNNYTRCRTEQVVDRKKCIWTCLLKNPEIRNVINRRN